MRRYTLYLHTTMLYYFYFIDTSTNKMYPNSTRGGGEQHRGAGRGGAGPGSSTGGRSGGGEQHRGAGSSGQSTFPFPKVSEIQGKKEEKVNRIGFAVQTAFGNSRQLLLSLSNT